MIVLCKTKSFRALSDCLEKHGFEFVVSFVSRQIKLVEAVRQIQEENIEKLIKQLIIIIMFFSYR